MWAFGTFLEKNSPKFSAEGGSEFALCVRTPGGGVLFGGVAYLGGGFYLGGFYIANRSEWVDETMKHLPEK